jgi:hypothetical protein
MVVYYGDKERYKRKLELMTSYQPDSTHTYQHTRAYDAISVRLNTHIVTYSSL